MRLVRALLVDVYYKTYEQHRRPRGAHERRQQEPDGQNQGVHLRGGLDVALYGDAARNHEQRAKQDYERQIVEQHLVFESAAQAVFDQIYARGHRKRDGDEQFVEIALPPLGGGERQHCYAQQHERERDKSP